MRWNRVVFLLSVLVAIVITWLLPPIPQDLHYHEFADQRSLGAIPHGQNVLSNIGITLAGLWGAMVASRSRTVYRHKGEKGLWLFFFAIAAITGIGSIIYHLDPRNHTLVVDRLPIAIISGTLMAIFLAERWSYRVGMWCFVPLVILGLASVMVWAIWDDLRFYGLVQFYPIVGIFLLLVSFPARYTATVLVAVAFALYILSKLFELFDEAIYDATGTLFGGHAWKHLITAIAIWFVALYLVKRELREQA